MRDTFTGTLKTMARAGMCRLRPMRASEQAADYRVWARPADIAGGWKKARSAEQDFLSIKLDDPDLDLPVYVRLFQPTIPTPSTLLWSRCTKANG